MKMAEGAVNFILEKISTLISEECQLLGGFQGKLQNIRDELELMRAFLRVADAEEKNDPELQAWVKQMREVAYDVEDVLDKFMRFFVGNPTPRGYLGPVKKFCQSMGNLRHRRQVASDIQSIEVRVKRITGRHQEFKDKYGGNEEQGSSSRHMWHDTRGDALLLEEDSLVDIRERKKQLIDLLLDGGSELKAVSVWGMGGSGKTTLVKRVYESVKNQFKTHAWVTISETYDIDDLLVNLIKQLESSAKGASSQQVRQLRGIKLKEFVKKFLHETSYVIVFDDIWKTDFWNAVRHALPNNNSCSRVLITTRIQDVALMISQEFHGHVHEMLALSPEESWTLFRKTTFRGLVCPPHLEVVSHQILNKCQGLPLVIAAIGGLLASKKQIFEEWDKVCRSLGNELGGHGKLGNVEKILSLSYYDLPYYLKSCFMYLSIFPEDYDIERERLIWLWIAEGFVQGRERMTKEEVAEDYLNELISRSLVQIGQVDLKGSFTTCRVHDIVREIILNKCREQNIATIANGGDDDTCWPDKVRRLAIHSSSFVWEKINETIIIGRKNKKFEHLRSLILMWRSFSNPFLDSAFVSQLLSSGSMRLFKVVDLSGYSNLAEIPSEVFKLYHLKYLGLQGTSVQILPKSIKKLQNLETLDLSRSKVIELPIEILTLKRLRHLISTYFLKVPNNIGCLTSLQILSRIEACETRIVKETGKLTQLRELGISKLKRQDGNDLCATLEKLPYLRTLFIVVKNDEILDIQHSNFSSSPHQFLSTLHLDGRLESMPQWIRCLHRLRALSLESNYIKETVPSLALIQDLPNLNFLRLHNTYDVGCEELCFRAGCFQRLKRLYIWRLAGLKRIKVEQGSMPNLQELLIFHCRLLEDVPSGMEYLTRLQSLDIDGMPSDFIAQMEAKGEEYHSSKFAHIPQVLIGAEWIALSIKHGMLQIREI